MEYYEKIKIQDNINRAESNLREAKRGLDLATSKCKCHTYTNGHTVPEDLARLQGNLAEIRKLMDISGCSQDTTISRLKWIIGQKDKLSLAIQDTNKCARRITEVKRVLNREL